MLGLANQPTWWTSRYGPAPYTSDNLVLWGDLETGTVWNDGTPFIKPSYARPGLSKIIPVKQEEKKKTDKDRLRVLEKGRTGQELLHSVLKKKVVVFLTP